MNSSELRQYFLAHCKPVVQHVLQTATGKQADFNLIEDDNVDINSYIKVWNLAEKIINEATDLQKIEAKTTENISTALVNGQINPQEALILMKTLSIKADIEEMPILLEKLNQLTEK